MPKQDPPEIRNGGASAIAIFPAIFLLCVIVAVIAL
jgi:hypothetical protein